MYLILSGAAERFGITDEELAVVCSSHYAEDYHLVAVRSILAKCGLSESDLQSGVARSIKPELALAQAVAGIEPQRILSDCSGKHSGMLASCVAKGYSILNYLDPEHPLQREIISVVSDICAYPMQDISVGVDGCNVPVFAMPIYNMALGFARLANPSCLAPHYREAASRIVKAMTSHPEMVSGTGGFCTALMQTTRGRMIGKIGAQGVYCIGIKEPELGIALKIEDGAVGTAAMAAMHILSELNLLTEEEYKQLQHFHIQNNLNDDRKVVGQVFPVFKLMKP